MTPVRQAVEYKKCPSCETHWFQDEDGCWHGEAVTGGCGIGYYNWDPLPDARRFCPMCAGSTSTLRERLTFIQDTSRELDFFRWLLDFCKSATESEELLKMLAFDTEEDRENYLDIRTAEFIEDWCWQEFAEWRCGD